MSKYNILLGASLSTLLFSGLAFTHGVQNDSSGDVITGHSTDHQDSVLNNPSKAQMPTNMAHSNEKDGGDMIHKITEHNEELSASPSSPSSDQHHVSDDDAPSIVHEITAH